MLLSSTPHSFPTPPSHLVKGSTQMKKEFWMLFLLLLLETAFHGLCNLCVSIWLEVWLKAYLLSPVTFYYSWRHLSISSSLFSFWILHYHEQRTFHTVHISNRPNFCESVAVPDFCRTSKMFPMLVCGGFYAILRALTAMLNSSGMKIREKGEYKLRN